MIRESAHFPTYVATISLKHTLEHCLQLETAEQEMRTFLASIREEDLTRHIEGVTDEGTASLLLSPISKEYKRCK
jgi:hypothetical protein